MPAEFVLLALVVLTALAFDFTNGFHDTANAMATSIATKALTPKAAVSLSAILNLVGAFLSVEVAITVTNAVIRIQNADGTPRPELTADGGSPLLLILLAGLAGGILWNILTWLWGLPSSSSHALFGGLIGATIAGFGFDSVKWVGEGNHLDGVVGKVILPALLSPTIAIVVAFIGTKLVFWVTEGVNRHYQEAGFRWGQIGTASLLSLSHGTNDAQKTMGVITLGLLASGHWTDTHQVPLWVKLACALAIASGTYLGGWRIIRTMGKGLVEISSPQGMAAESASAAVILTSSQFGFPLSTTHVATGSILGSGLGRKGAEVRWGVAGRMGLAWLITLPAAALVGAAMWLVGHLVGGAAGGFVIAAIMIAAWLWMWLHSRKSHVSHHNVNDEWEPEPAPEPVPASTTGSEQ
ncbi:MAG: inorganic phosphate transporter [Propionicimonas sp.]|uniref:inorganic phosphate transporter n=1 Tax=Propionicimonas sp. TaxID=1955623 RepID=UPI002B1FB4F7|nr:inorganic phosphate transporter [Propionicimonas sp.]MEA4943514.1 inorganic phosphate transporter [Propionicimonas sp.]MEA5054823.1 inorganic phosphate transporter [Propionicimonas sp.]MEA5118883.1 inorganic phosphate transporter [Propionicimonas sp.]